MAASGDEEDSQVSVSPNVRIIQQMFYFSLSNHTADI